MGSSSQHNPADPRRPARQPFRPARPARVDTGLDDTVADEAVLPERPTSAGRRAQDSGLSDSFEAFPMDSFLDGHAATPVGEEIEVFHQHLTVSSAVSTDTGKMVLALLALLVGIGLAIAAIVIQTNALIIAAAVVGPISLVIFVCQFRGWIGHKRFIYRLLQALGEDVSEMDAVRSTKRR